MEEFLFFHDYIIVVLCYILTVVGVMMVRVRVLGSGDKFLSEGQVLEGV